MSMPISRKLDPTGRGGIDIIFQSQIIPHAYFKDDNGKFSVFICTEQAIIYQLIFSSDRNLIDGYNETISWNLSLNSLPKYFTFLPTSDTAIIADEKNSINCYKISTSIPHAALKIKSYFNSVSSFKAFIKGVVGKNPNFHPVGLNSFGNDGVVIIYSNYLVEIWDVNRGILISKNTIPTIMEGKNIEHTKIGVKLIGQNIVLLSIGFSTDIFNNDWSIASYIISLPLTSAAFFLAKK